MIAPARPGVAALLATPDGRYLMQHRDRAPGNRFPGRWCCFGGGIEAGETPEAALRREVLEEVGYRAGKVRRFTEFDIVLPFRPPYREHILYFAVPLPEAALAGLQLGEGAAMALWLPGDLAREDLVVPWDLSAVLMHARRRALFRGRGVPR